MPIFSHFFSTGQENYENQFKYGKETFKELQDIKETGHFFEGHHHTVDIVCCSDWKAAACIEGAKWKFIKIDKSALAFTDYCLRK